jgi:hypothetical protein
VNKFLAILLLFTLAACGQLNKSTKKSKIPNWKTLDHKEYSIQYPPDWGVNQTGMMNTEFYLISPPDDKNDMFRENVSFAIQDLTGYGVDLGMYVEMSEAQIPSLLSNSKIIESTRVTTEKPEFHKIIYSGEYENKDMVFEQYYWVVNQKAYLLTLTCAYDKFIAYKATGEKIFNSLIVKKWK